MKRLIRLEAKKLNKKSFIDKVLQDGYITLDDGSLFYSVVQINEQNFPNMYEQLKKQLEDEGKYNWWISVCTNTYQPPFDINCLPIYGSSEHFETKFFTSNPQQQILNDLSDRQYGLLRRANEYLDSKNE